MVGVWEGLNLGSIPNCFLCFGMHPKIIDVHPKLIPKGGVVQFCLFGYIATGGMAIYASQFFGFLADYMARKIWLYSHI